MTEVLIGRGESPGELDVIHGDEVMFEGVENLTYSGLFDRYASSPFGEFHAQQPLRYSNKYAYDPTAMLQDLGDNIHPIRHMQYTESAIFRPLAEAQSDPTSGAVELLMPKDITTGRLAALLHDIGESEHPTVKEACGATIGDVNFWEKNSDHDKQERIIRQFFYETLYSDIPQGLLYGAEDIIANPDATFPGQTFATAEQIGYYLADIAAGVAAVALKDSIDSAADALRFDQLKKMSTGEIPVWHERLSAKAERFPYVATVLEQTTPTADNILATLS